MALSTSEKVISLDGDGSLLMNMGTIASIGREQPRNLVVVVWDNEQWAQTGNQLSHTAYGTDLEQVARGCGIAKTATVREEEELQTVLMQALEEDGPWFIVAKIEEEAGVHARRPHRARDDALPLPQHVLARIPPVSRIAIQQPRLIYCKYGRYIR